MKLLIWLCAASVLVVIAASASIWGALDDHRDLRAGHPTFDSLVSYTGVWRRDLFIQMLGEPDPMDRFALPTDKIQELPVSWWTRFFDNTFTDIVSIIISIAAPIAWTQNATMAIVLLAVGAGVQSIGYGIAAIVTYRSGIWRKWLSEDQA